MIQAIHIEDELPAQKILQNYLHQTPEVSLLASFQCITAAQDYLEKHTIDLLFVDIELPDANGFEFVQQLPNSPAIVFTTAYPQYAASSFEIESIVDYLVKPFSFDRFQKTVQKINKWQQQEETLARYIYVNADKTLHNIPLKTLIYIESDRNYITMVCTNKKLCIIDSLQHWKAKLGAPFIQIHKSYLVNSQHIQKIQGNKLYIGQQQLPIGRTYKKNVKIALGLTDTLPQ
ncbi:MAG: LytTR family DNA-binding domain-containing protein [Flavobacteriaceae bacterium]|nr:LytTR family DNA-binding domain-containing protein [Flavobacteriaceae bacterium]